MIEWVKQANKLGKLVMTYRKFRVYEVKAPVVNETYENRPDGLYRITEFIKGEFVAVNREGVKLMANNYETIGWEIDKYYLLKY